VVSPDGRTWVEGKGTHADRDRTNQLVLAKLEEVGGEAGKAAVCERLRQENEYLDPRVLLQKELAPMPEQLQRIGEVADAVFKDLRLGRLAELVEKAIPEEGGVAESKEETVAAPPPLAPKASLLIVSKKAEFDPYRTAFILQKVLPESPKPEQIEHLYRLACLTLKKKIVREEEERVVGIVTCKKGKKPEETLLEKPLDGAEKERLALLAVVGLLLFQIEGSVAEEKVRDLVQLQGELLGQRIGSFDQRMIVAQVMTLKTERTPELLERLDETLEALGVSLPSPPPAEEMGGGAAAGAGGSRSETPETVSRESPTGSRQSGADHF
jgi:hypothetical protein